MKKKKKKCVWRDPQAGKPCDGPEPSKCLRRQTITPQDQRCATSPDSGTWFPPPSACQLFLQLNTGDTAAVVDAAESCMRPGDFSALAQALDLWQRSRRVGVGDCYFSNMLTHFPPANHGM